MWALMCIPTCVHTRCTYIMTYMYMQLALSVYSDFQRVEICSLHWRNHGYVPGPETWRPQPFHMPTSGDVARDAAVDKQFSTQRTIHLSRTSGKKMTKNKSVSEQVTGILVLNDIFLCVALKKVRKVVQFSFAYFILHKYQ